MISLRYFSFLFVFWISLLSTACAEQTEILEITNQSNSISWMNDQKILISSIDSSTSWIFSINKQQITKLPKAFSYDEILASPSGQYVLTTYWDKKNRLSILNSGADDIINSIKSVVIPAMPIVDPDVEKPHFMLVYWVSNTRVYVEHFNMSSNRRQCQLFDITKQSWNKKIKCFDLLQYPGTPGEVDYLGHDLYAVYSSAEGDVSVRIIKWTPQDGTSKTNYPVLSLGFNAKIQFFYEPQQSALYLLSTVPIGFDSAIGDRGKDYINENFKLYRWAGEKGFIEAKQQLSSDKVLKSVSSEKTTWIDAKQNKICLGRMSKPIVCHDLKL